MLLHPLKLGLVGGIPLDIGHAGGKQGTGRITQVGMNPSDGIPIPTIPVDHLVDPDIGVL